jgi:hypothetical protein
MLVNDYKIWHKWHFNIKVLFHVLLGVLVALQPDLVPLWALYIILVEGGYRVYRHRNAGGQAHLAAAYLCGLEMVMRMSRSGLPHELAKYGVIFILLNGLMVLPRLSKKSWPILFYFVLQIPSVVFLSDHPDLRYARELLSFNLSGPLCLTISTLYFFHRRLHAHELALTFQKMILPIVSTVVWLFIRTPSISEIDFFFGANFSASGYGPNQMASILGGGMFVIGLSWLFKLPFYRSRILILILFSLFAYRGLLTFSRGGMVVPVSILVLLFVMSFTFSKAFRKKIGYIAFSAIILAFAGYQIYEYTNRQTGDALANRYQGVSYGQEVGIEKYSSGRLEIAEIDWNIFKDHMVMGIGPGMGTDLRFTYGYTERVAAHLEFSRLLAEHGLFGMVALLILLFLPLREYLRRRSFQQQYMLIAGVLFCFGFMAHSATRIALPMFMYGLGFIYIIQDQKHDTLPR